MNRCAYRIVIDNDFLAAYTAVNLYNGKLRPEVIFLAAYTAVNVWSAAYIDALVFLAAYTAVNT